MSVFDIFKREGTEPSSFGIAITPSDVTELVVTRGVYVGGTGDLAVLMSGDTVPVTFTAVQKGSVLPIRVKKVMASNTTATFIIALL